MQFIEFSAHFFTMTIKITFETLNSIAIFTFTLKTAYDISYAFKMHFFFYKR